MYNGCETKDLIKQLKQHTYIERDRLCVKFVEFRKIYDILRPYSGSNDKWHDPLEEFGAELNGDCICDIDLNKVFFCFTHRERIGDEYDNKDTYKDWLVVTIKDDLVDMEYWKKEI